MPAGRVLGVILIALAIAALFNSEALVRAGEGMQPGTTRDTHRDRGGLFQKPSARNGGFVPIQDHRVHCAIRLE